MTSAVENLFSKALGLETPWIVEKIEFSQEENRLDIHLGFTRGSKFTCPKCGRAEVPAYDTHDKSWRHLNFFQHQAFLHAPEPRIQCPVCGVKTAAVPWARSDSGFSLLFEALIMMLVSSMPVSAAARILGEHDTRLWRVIRHYVGDAREREDYFDVTKIAVDETARKRGHAYVSIVADLDRSKVIFAVEGKDSRVIGKFSNDFHDHGGDSDYVREVCCDMSPAFIEGVRHCLPNARVTFDRFHVMKIVNEAVDKVRREEQQTQTELKKSRYVWLKNPENLTVKQRDQLYDLEGRNLNTVKAYHMKLNLRDFWTMPEKHAKSYLLRWLICAMISGLKPMIDAARTIDDHFEGIMAFTKTKITNGIMEGINSLVQAARKKARGYRSVDYFITMIYLIAGKLNFRLPT
jgi:transposase